MLCSQRGDPYVYSEYLFSCSTPYVGTREQETSELETPHQVEIVSQRPEQETLAFDEPVIVDHRENSYSHYCEGFTNSGDDYH